MKKRSDIDAIVFDLGRVLLTFDPLPHLQKLYPAALAERMNEAVYASRHWAEVDRGVLTMEEVVARILRDAPDMAEWIQPALDSYFDMIRPIPENVALLPKLKKAGYRLYVLSNFGESFFARTRACNPFLEQFDGLLISGEARILKPDVAIYLLLLHKFRLDPARTLFVDDRRDNIDGARAVGIRGICYSYHEQLEELFARDA